MEQPFELQEPNTSAWRRNIPNRDVALVNVYRRLLELHKKEQISTEVLEQQRADITEKIGIDPALVIAQETQESTESKQENSE